MAIDTLRMDGNQFVPHYGNGAGYAGAYYDPYARQTQMQPALRGPPLRSRQAGYFGGGYGRPHNSFKPMNFIHGGGAKRKFDATFHQAQAHGQGHPSQLQQLRDDNLKKTRRHFQGILRCRPFPRHSLVWKRNSPSVLSPSASDPVAHAQGAFESASTPRIAPRAPDNRHGFLLSTGSSVVPSSPGSRGALHIITPSAVPGGEAQLWKNSYGNADKEAVQLAAAAGLDFLGSFYDDGASAAAEDDDVDVADHESDADEVKGATGAGAHSEPEQPPNTFDEEASFPPQAKRKLASQAAYIAQLEEQQLTLRERIFLLEQQLAEAQRQQQAASPGHSGDVEDASDEERATSSSE